MYHMAQHRVASFYDSGVLSKCFDLEDGTEVFQLVLCGVAIES